MACSSIFRFIIYHRRCCIRGWSVFLEKDSWLAWMPRAVWRADVLEHKWFLCFIFNTPCSTHPFPPFTLSPLTVPVFLPPLCCSLLLSIIFSQLPFLFVIIPLFISSISGTLSQILTQFPVPFCFVLTGRDGVFVVLFKQIFFRFRRARVALVGKDTGGSLFWTACRSTSECVVRPNEPILAAASLSNFLSDCMPALSFLSSALAHSLDLSLSWLKAFRQTKVTADFSSNHIKLTTQGCSQLWAIFSLHLSDFLFSVFPPRSFCLPVSA